MRKKSHLSLSHLLLKDLREFDSSLLQHKNFFYLGSILPDISPSFLYRKHNITDTFHVLKHQLDVLADVRNNGMDDGRSFWLRLGIVTHYLADYCTFPHNSIFDGTLHEHCNYEEDLKHAMRSYVRNPKTETAVFDTVPSCVQDILTSIETLHQEYLKAIKQVQADCEYIVEMCHVVVFSILQLLRNQCSESYESVAAISC